MVDYMSGLTPEDLQTWGGDLINLTQRSALHAVSPHLQSLEQQNAELRQRLAQEARHRLDQQVAAAVPDDLEIDRIGNGIAGCWGSMFLPDGSDRDYSTGRSKLHSF